jgi:hypothetical protein
VLEPSRSISFLLLPGPGSNQSLSSPSGCPHLTHLLGTKEGQIPRDFVLKTGCLQLGHASIRYETMALMTIKNNNTNRRQNSKAQRNMVSKAATDQQNNQRYALVLRFIDPTAPLPSAESELDALEMLKCSALQTAPRASFRSHPIADRNGP